MIAIRRLKKGEGTLYKQTRLFSLKDSPQAFCSSYEDALKRSDQSWHDQADFSALGNDRATFIAIDKHPVGLAAIYRDQDDPNVGELIQMWVAPEKRGGTVANGLLDALMKWAVSSGMLIVIAEVMASNSRALQFYEKYGFSRSSKRMPHAETSLILTMQIEKNEEF